MTIKGRQKQEYPLVTMVMARQKVASVLADEGPQGPAVRLLTFTIMKT